MPNVLLQFGCPVESLTLLFLHNKNSSLPETNSENADVYDKIRDFDF